MERLVLPTPFPVGPVNCWLLRGQPLTLVDTGPDTPEALAALEAGLGDLGLRIEDVELLLLTHQHSDHLGLAATIVERSGCEVAAHRVLAPYAADVQAAMEAELEWEQRLLDLHGADPARRDAFVEVFHARAPYAGRGVSIDRLLDDGDVVEAGGRRLTVALRPGHSPTDTVFADEAAAVAFVGDHLIAHISSNPLVHRPPGGHVDPALRPSSLIAYLESLVATETEEHRLLHTGHGADIADHRTLIAERVRLHHARAAQVHDVLAAGPQTAAGVSTELWPRIAVNQAFLTLCEVLGALDLLEDDGRVTARLEDGVIVYARR